MQDKIAAEKLIIDAARDAAITAATPPADVWTNPYQDPTDFVFNPFVDNNATGTDNWRGGLTTLHEKGDEIYNLPGGTSVIPHEISMEIARAIGESAGGSGSGVIHVDVILDGNVIATAISPYQQKNARIRARGIGVTD